jgi:hypothetical protein
MLIEASAATDAAAPGGEAAGEMSEESPTTTVQGFFSSKFFGDDRWEGRR